MNFRSASSNTAGTVLTVRGRREERSNGRTRFTEEHAAYVVSGDAREIAKSLNLRAQTGLRAFFGMRFHVTDLPGAVRAINTGHVDAEIAAEGITHEERDYFFSSGFSQHEIFDRIIERSKAERKKHRADRADKIRADLNAIAPILDDQNTDQ